MTPAKRKVLEYELFRNLNGGPLYRSMVFFAAGVACMAFGMATAWNLLDRITVEGVIAHSRLNEAVSTSRNGQPYVSESLGIRLVGNDTREFNFELGEKNPLHRQIFERAAPGTQVAIGVPGRWWHDSQRTAIMGLDVSVLVAGQPTTLARNTPWLGVAASAVGAAALAAGLLSIREYRRKRREWVELTGKSRHA